jgi:hypothetical protein
MSRKIPKLALRHNFRERTPPPLFKWDLTDLERERWEALTLHSRAFKNAETSQYPPSLHLQATSAIQIRKPPNAPPKPSPQKPRPTHFASQEPEPHRPVLMPSLDIEETPTFPIGNSLLEKAEGMAATEPVDQNSLRYQVMLRKNLEKLHQEELDSKETVEGKSSEKKG